MSTTSVTTTTTTTNNNNNNTNTNNDTNSDNNDADAADDDDDDDDDDDEDPISGFSEPPRLPEEKRHIHKTDITSHQHIHSTQIITPKSNTSLFRQASAAARGHPHARVARGGRTSPRAVLSCDIHTHTPAKKSSTNFLLYPFLLRKCSAHCLGHGHGYECHRPRTLLARPYSAEVALATF